MSIGPRNTAAVLKPCVLTVTEVVVTAPMSRVAPLFAKVGKLGAAVQLGGTT